MRGALVCISGEPDNWSLEDECRFRNQFGQFDVVHIVTPQIIHLMFHRIWFKMISSGITDIVIAIANFSIDGNLEFHDRCYRLPITAMN